MNQRILILVTILLSISRCHPYSYSFTNELKDQAVDVKVIRAGATCSDQMMWNVKPGENRSWSPTPDDLCCIFGVQAYKTGTGDRLDVSEKLTEFRFDIEGSDPNCAAYIGFHNGDRYTLNAIQSVGGYICENLNFGVNDIGVYWWGNSTSTGVKTGDWGGLVNLDGFKLYSSRTCSDDIKPPAPKPVGRLSFINQTGQQIHGITFKQEMKNPPAIDNISLNDGSALQKIDYYDGAKFFKLSTANHLDSKMIPIDPSKTYTLKAGSNYLDVQ